MSRIIGAEKIRETNPCQDGFLHLKTTLRQRPPRSDDAHATTPVLLAKRAVDRREANRREPTAIVSAQRGGRLMAERSEKGDRHRPTLVGEGDDGAGVAGVSPLFLSRHRPRLFR